MRVILPISKKRLYELNGWPNLKVADVKHFHKIVESNYDPNCFHGHQHGECHAQKQFILRSNFRKFRKE